MLTDEMRADGWIDHDGSEDCPTGLGAMVECLLRNGKTGVNVACNIIWQHDGRGDDIIAYKPEPKP